MNRDFVIETLQSGDFEDLLKCVLRAFPCPIGEVMACALNITAEEYRSYAEMVCQKAIKDGVSLVVRDQATEAIAGFLICEDFTSMPNYLSKPINRKFLPLLALLGELDEAYCSLRNPKPGEVLHLYMLGVDPNWMKHGLGKQLVQSALEMGTQLGFSQVVAETTGEGSQHICQRLGFEKISGVKYRDFRYEGVEVFRSIEKPAECLIVERYL